MTSATSRRSPSASPATFALRARVSHRGKAYELSVRPDLVFGLLLPTGERCNFMVEIDRGTMPISRADLTQTSIEGKCAFISQLTLRSSTIGSSEWKNFRVLIITTDSRRIASMVPAARRLHLPRGVGPRLFFFNTFDALRSSGPFLSEWYYAEGAALRRSGT
jgi:hypothetical protein